MTLKQIYLDFDGKLVGSAKLKEHVCEVVALLPEAMQQQITKTCWFIGSYEEAWAFTFTGNDLKGHHLIFLSDALLMEDKSQIHYTITHEIGHVVLNHRNSTLVKQSKEEIERQEKEANIFAKKYIKISNS